MGINNLPEELKALALLRCKEKPLKRYKENDKDLIFMFDWADSPEKSLFWDDVNSDNYTIENVEYARKISNIDCSPLLFS